MTSTKFKVESGMQMLARLTKKPDIQNFYPKLFKLGPKQGHLIELYSDDDLSCLLCDLICESLMPLDLGGKEAGVIIFNSDGKLNINMFVKLLRKKLLIKSSDLTKIDYFLEKSLSNLFVFDIYNATQLHSTIQSLDSILINHPNVSLIVFDNLSAFYWSKQNFKITKMDIYLKTLLRIVQNVVKDYKVVILYTRPEHFSSSKDYIEKLDACCEHQTLEQLNYRIQVVYNEDGTHYATVRSYNEQYQKSFQLLDDFVIWL